MSTSRTPIRVLVVEDSAVTRQLLAALLAETTDFELLETVADGRRSVERVVALAPDVVTMDIHLPGIDGIEATRRIMQRRPTPVLVVTASGHMNGETVFDALQAGALGVVKRPMPPGHHEYEPRRRRFLAELRSIAEVHLGEGRAVAARAPAAPPRPPRFDIRPRTPVEIIGVAASTGGPSALRRLLADLRGVPLPPVLIVQHMSPGFLPGLAEWLAEGSSRTVRVARAGEQPRRDEVLIAPDDRHLTLGPNGRVRLDAGALVGGHRPSADALFTSLAEVHRAGAMGIILTGMGRDGARGLANLRRAGATTLGQDRATSVVYGMPAAAAEIGALDRTAPLDELASMVASALRSAPPDVRQGEVDHER